jgi:hypothetical protein
MAALFLAFQKRAGATATHDEVVSLKRPSLKAFRGLEGPALIGVGAGMN